MRMAMGRESNEGGTSMSNMSYCRFIRNTRQDLCDCYEHMGDSPEQQQDDGGNSPDEEIAMKQLISLCVMIAEQYGEEA